jgi:hypothetical protein
MTYRGLRNRSLTLATTLRIRTEQSTKGTDDDQSDNASIPNKIDRMAGS